MSTNQQEKYAEKIAKLLRKAETTTAEEAEALVAKAQELMTQYAIDELMIAQARGDNLAEREEIVQIELEYTGIFQAVLMGIGSAAARHNDCRCVYRVNEKGLRTDPETGKPKPKAHILTVTGFQSDIDKIQLLNTSLQVQCSRAMTTWWKQSDRSWMSKMQQFKERRQFIASFIHGLESRLREAVIEGQKQAAKNEAERANVSEAQATESVALVMRSRKDQVNDWMDQKYGKLRSVSRSYQSGSSGASSAGYAAGRSADLGGGNRVGGSRKALGR